MQVDDIGSEVESDVHVVVSELCGEVIDLENELVSESVVSDSTTSAQAPAYVLVLGSVVKAARNTSANGGAGVYPATECGPIRPA